MRRLTRNEYKIMSLLWRLPKAYLTKDNMINHVREWKGDQKDIDDAINGLFRDGFIKNKFFDSTLRNGIQSSVTQEEYNAWEEEYRNNNRNRLYGSLYEIYEGQPTDKVAE